MYIWLGGIHFQEYNRNSRTYFPLFNVIEEVDQIHSTRLNPRVTKFIVTFFLITTKQLKVFSRYIITPWYFSLFGKLDNLLVHLHVQEQSILTKSTFTSRHDFFTFLCESISFTVLRNYQCNLCKLVHKKDIFFLLLLFV